MGETAPKVSKGDRRLRLFSLPFGRLRRGEIPAHREKLLCVIEAPFCDKNKEDYEGTFVPSSVARRNTVSSESCSSTSIRIGASSPQSRRNSCVCASGTAEASHSSNTSLTSIVRVGSAFTRRTHGSDRKAGISCFSRMAMLARSRSVSPVSANSCMSASYSKCPRFRMSTRWQSC